MGRKSGSITPRGQNRWLIRWYVGKTPSGKRHYASKIIEGTHKQAQNALAKETTEVADGGYVPPAKQTLGEFLMHWLEKVKAQEVREATLVSYRRRIVPDVIERIGGLKLDKVTPQVIQNLYAEATERGLSPRTVQYTHVLLSEALNKAVAWKQLRSNPCEHVTLPRRSKGEMAAWSPEETQAFLRATEGTRDYALWYTLLHTGMRPGEAFGLKWSDLDGDRLRIQRAVAESATKGQWVLAEPKTKQSARSIAISQEHLAILKSHKKAQLEEILAAGENYQRQEFIFADKEGYHETVVHVRGRWKTALRRAKVREIRLYDTRHTHATLLLRAGVHPKVVSERLGHASIVITLETYSHVMPDMQDEAVSRLSAVLSAAK